LQCSTRVSNELGAGRSRTAQLSVCVGVCMAAIEALMIGYILFSVRNVWGYAYSNEVEVVEYISTMMPLLVPSTFMDAIQGVLSGR
jgi:MATE family multidrug resistance protein